MKSDKVLEIVIREMTAYTDGWCMDWSDFDGRRLRNQMEELEKWAVYALEYDKPFDYTEGSRFLKERE